ncbi:hypothetical protein SAMN05216410_0444 [Sanguibacter gelidistatuariae]|uniref:Uncharacterized protein n=1 Tax=Sanguibacter gelidistatuariae TaxID=1814289 RepID=A0A1G6GSS5_9MICO|nr:hypothetical protein [Sanguibacter gelidistatuariae]SDB85038.1 hypothetical protein SAMN05216410_0444 [Sanguibacter gelidistatuariae]
MPVDRAAEAAAAPSGEQPAPLAAPSFVMVGADDAGICIDGVCALPSSPAQA